MATDTTTDSKGNTTTTNKDSFGNVTTVTKNSSGTVTGTERYNTNTPSGTDLLHVPQTSSQNGNSGSGSFQYNEGKNTVTVTYESESPQNTIYRRQARSAGYSEEDINKAIKSGQGLLPSQSQNVQEFVAQGAKAGYNNKEILHAYEAGYHLTIPAELPQEPQPVDKLTAQFRNNMTTYVRPSPQSQEPTNDNYTLPPRLQEQKNNLQQRSQSMYERYNQQMQGIGLGINENDFPITKFAKSIGQGFVQSNPIGIIGLATYPTAQGLTQGKLVSPQFPVMFEAPANLFETGAYFTNRATYNAQLLWTGFKNIERGTPSLAQVKTLRADSQNLKQESAQLVGSFTSPESVGLIVGGGIRSAFPPDRPWQNRLRTVPQ